MGRLQAGVHSKLSALGIDETKVDDINSLDDPFKGLETKHMAGLIKLTGLLSK